MTRREQRRLGLSIGLTVVVATLLTLALQARSFSTLQSIAADIFFQTWLASDVRAVADNVVIVAIDDASVQRLGRFGDWPRSHYARLVDRLAAGHARAIAFDIGFIEPHPDDGEVAAALRRFLDVTPEQLRQAGVPLNRRNVISPIVGTPNTARSSAQGRPHAYPQSLQPQPVYLEASTALGHVNVLPDDDGTVRKTPLLIRLPQGDVPSLALASAAAYTNTLSRGFVPAEGGSLAALNRAMPADPYYQMIISFAGPPSRATQPGGQTFRVVSFIDVLDGRVEPSVFRDKMVFVGLLDATGFADDFNVPTSRGAGKMHGVEIHANAFATLVSARFFAEQQFPVTATVIWLAALATGVAAARLSIILSAVGTVAAGALYVLGSFAYAGIAYDPAGTAMPNVLYPPLALLFTFLGVSTYRVVFEAAERRATRAAMGKYLSPPVLEQVLKDPDQLRLGGEKRVMTVLFTDIRGFTSVAEKLPPEDLVALLNEYLTVMTAVVHRWLGVLDKYMGDAVMAWWGAPTNQVDHAYRASMAALDMRSELQKLHLQWAERGVPRLEMGVGINTGPMVYGNIGSEDRFDFTVMGDAVNLASRLEGANKEYGSNVIISESTYVGAQDHGFAARFLDVIEVKGKTEPVGIYELLGTSLEPHAQLVATWDQAMALYRARDFARAEEAFRAVLELALTDGPAAVYVQRCQELRESPPAADWDGVFVMTHK